MGHPLILDEVTREKIAAVVAYAEKNRFSLPLMMGIQEGSEPPAGFDPGFCCEIQIGYRVVYSIEEHPCGWCHHISASFTDGSEKVPGPIAMRAIMLEFGIKNPLNECILGEDPDPHVVSLIIPFTALHEVQN